MKNNKNKKSKILNVVTIIIIIVSVLINLKINKEIRMYESTLCHDKIICPSVMPYDSVYIHNPVMISVIVFNLICIIISFINMKKNNENLPIVLFIISLIYNISYVIEFLIFII